MALRLRQSTRDQFLDPSTFIWCTGIEDTFITSPWPQTGRTLDEYELTGHYERQQDDIGLMAELGVQAARYGIPWHRINPQKGIWEWEWVDRAVDRLLDLGIEPIIDLVHYGLPSWIEQAFLNPDFPEYMAEYAGRVAQRYKGRVFAYTPLNEPRITAWYCGRIGWWPPFKKSWAGFVAVMAGVCRGIVRTVETLREVDPEILPVHVDATDLYSTAEPGLQEEADLRQEIVFLALDLISGRITSSHALYPWLLRHKFTERELGWFIDHAIELPFIGINLYPMFTQKKLVRTSTGGMRIRMPYGEGKLVSDIGRKYWERYRTPLFISETASLGSVRKRSAWLTDSLGAVAQLRAEGVPMVGYTWWPLFALVTWGYRQGTKPPASYLIQMGLWDLDNNLERIPTPLVKAYQTHCKRKADDVGLLQQPGELNPSLPV